MTLPRLLVVDDQFGRFFDARRDLCAMYDLRDVTGDDSEPENVPHPQAEAVFCSGQIVGEGEVRNSVEVAIAAAGAGWPFGDGSRWALLLLDLRFVSGPLDPQGKPSGCARDDAFGLHILEHLKRQYPDLPVVILSSRERAEVIEDCRRLGAADFIQRHVSAEGQNPRRVLADKLREHGLLEDTRGIIVGRALPLLKALASARRAATGSGNILLVGESGTGKELLARYVHDHSPKAKGSYRIFHPFGTAETLQEDLLFGHVKGAFTDARTERAGLFEQANGGTLFIDEIGDIPEPLQNKLLRPIETRRVMQQGGNEEIELDIQLVLATNKALDDYVLTGRFKFDLLNRIRAYPITLPPLRERREDIALLIEQIVESLCREHGARWPRAIQREATEKLVAHDWREGNVRELRNVLERVVKDNKDSEIIVSGDIRFDGAVQPAAAKKIWIPMPNPGEPGHVVGQPGWVRSVADIQIPHDYQLLHGSWPLLQQETALLLARYLARAIEATRKRRPGGPPDGEINMTGAVSCLLGQQVSTIKAADFVKRLLQFDEEDLEATFAAFPVLRETLTQALRIRPRQPRKVATNVGRAT